MEEREKENERNCCLLPEEMRMRQEDSAEEATQKPFSRLLIASASNAPASFPLSILL